MSASSRLARGWRLAIAIAVALVVLPVGLVGAAQAGPPVNPGSVGPNGQPYGMSYGEWGAAWWQWASAFPAGADPISEGDGEVEFGDADDQPPGPVWFLAGNFIGGAVHRSLAVPAGTALFFPLVNFVFWSPEDCEFLGLDRCRATDLKHAVRDVQDATTNLIVTVDQRAFTGLDKYTGLSKAFPLVIDEGTVFNVFGGYQAGVRDPSVSGGHWMMLAPLPVGVHTIHWGGQPGGEIYEGFPPQDITYTITVQ